MQKPAHGGFFSLGWLNCSGLCRHRYRKSAALFTYYSATTFTADGPLAPFSIENSTF